MIDDILRYGRMTRHLPYIPKFGALRRIYARAFPRGKLDLRVDDFDGNLKMEVDVREVIGFRIWHTPEVFERYERKLFCDSLAPGCVVLDVGANVGIYTLLAAKRGARVFAVEADPRNVEVLRRHVRINGFDDRVTIIHMAAAEKKGAVSLYRSRGNSGHSNLFEGVDSVLVPSNTIDSLKLPAIDVCKMDIEGAELMALSGMGETIVKSPNMKTLVEYAKSFGRTDGLMEIISAQFETVYAIRDWPLRPKGPLVAGQKLPGHCNLWVSGRRPTGYVA